MITDEASHLELSPGVWPASIIRVEDGVGVPYWRSATKCDADGDVMYVDYRNGHMTLRVFND